MKMKFSFFHFENESHFHTYEIGYPVTEIEFPFDEITFPINETDSKNMNSEIT